LLVIRSGFKKKKIINVFGAGGQMFATFPEKNEGAKGTLFDRYFSYITKLKK
jgi:hypothetical protein